MRHKQIAIYKFEELSDKAKQTAINYLAGEHFWGDDSIASLKAFAAYFGVTIKDWSYAPFGNADITTDATNANFRGFNKDSAKAMPEGFTGYCMDYTLREVFLKEFERTGDALFAFNEAMDAGIREARTDWESQYSEEYMQDHCDANGYEFTEEGELA